MNRQMASAAIDKYELRLRRTHLQRCNDIDDNTSNIQHRIFKVHDRLRRRNNEAYEPECLSIGPYHRGKDHLQDLEEHKKRFLEELLDRAEPSSRERYTAALKEVEEQARRFYGDKISLSKDDDFVEMMLLDGFFIIEFLRRRHNSQLCVQADRNIFNTPWLLKALHMDLILFENQIPFFILEKLFDKTKLRDQQQNLIQLAKGLVPKYAAPGCQSATVSLDGRGDDQVIHLLDLLHKICCSSFAAKFTSPTVGDANDAASIYYIKCTSELEESGVKFKRAAKNAAWLDITWENGVMKIPQLIVYDTTECVLRNLIAYEQHDPNLYCQRTYVTDYVHVMDLLINSPQDVEKLRHCQIIENWLGDDKAVSTMFNNLTKEIMFNPALFCYSDVLKEVHTFSGKKRNIWRAKAMRDYFNTPWSIISFLAAVVLLLLTILQTIFTILSSINKN